MHKWLPIDWSWHTKWNSFINPDLVPAVAWGGEANQWKWHTYQEFLLLRPACGFITPRSPGWVGEGPPTPDSESLSLSLLCLFCLCSPQNLCVCLFLWISEHLSAFWLFLSHCLSLATSESQYFPAFPQRSFRLLECSWPLRCKLGVQFLSCTRGVSECSC